MMLFDFMGLALFAKPCPVVSMAHIQQRPGVVKVSGSFQAQARAAVDHFRQLGLRSIAMLRLQSPDPGREQVFLEIIGLTARMQAVYSEVVDSALLDHQDLPVIPVPPKLAAWFRSLPKPVGIFCGAMGGGGYAIRVCAALGLRVPEDVAVIGSDDADLSLGRDPTLTSVIPVGESIGSEAARVLSQIMSGGPIPQETVLIDAMDLRVRHSTGLQRAQV